MKFETVLVAVSGGIPADQALRVRMRLAGICWEELQVARADVIEERVIRLTRDFGRYVRVYDEQVSFTSEQLAAHRACIALRKQAGSVRAAVNSAPFLQALLRMLRAWGIGVRASRLVPADQFGAALRAALPALEELEPLAIDDSGLPVDIAERLWRLVESLGVVENMAKIVAGTKTLHHLLPDLVPPMDREWTGAFFSFHDPEWQKPESQRKIFTLAYTRFVGLAQQVRPEQYVTGDAWRTSRTKVIDNALIGFCKAELGEQPLPVDEGGNQVSFEVAGFPPPKGEAISMLGAGHHHAPRVRLLLEAASDALDEQGFTPIQDGPVALDVVVRCPAGGNPADATNLLGGIADVLEEKSHRGSLDHLGALAQVRLYRNDRQVKQVSYREVAADQVSYTVTIREL
ncbi:MAG TPA: hypothetical protein VGS06_36880 [Streptosporangiaceae bacterium]|nr:hypothetical protein [Streptosporangiaceae bacterium]